MSVSSKNIVVLTENVGDLIRAQKDDDYYYHRNYYYRIRV